MFPLAFVLRAASNTAPNYACRRPARKNVLVPEGRRTDKEGGVLPQRDKPAPGARRQHAQRDQHHRGCCRRRWRRRVHHDA